MVNKDTDLTYRDCPYYTCRSAGDWSQSVCNLSGKLCDADEAGLECSIWEQEKAEIQLEEITVGINVESACPSCNYPIKVVTEVYKIHNRDGSLHTCYGVTIEDVLPDTASQSS